MDQRTEKLYDADAYRTDFSARVLSCAPEGERFLVVLDRTVFFPESGGQTPDGGTLRTAGAGAEAISVLDVQIDDTTGVIVHTADRALPVGAEVRGEIDWARRFDNMQQHTGEHIFSGILCGRYGCSNVGFHLSGQTVTMDYDRALTAEDVAAVEALANGAIWRDIPVEARYPSAEELEALDYRSKKELSGPIRIVTIPGIDVCACCAPHVRRTGEIGLLKVLALQNYKGGVRVTIACGKRALAHLSEQRELLAGMARALSTAPEEVPGQVARLREELSETRRRLSQMREAMLEQRLYSISSDMITTDMKQSMSKSASGEEPVLLFDGEADGGAARRVLDRWMGRHGGVCGIFLGDDAQGYQYLIGAGRQVTPEGASVGGGAAASADARVCARRLAEALGAKGGGSREMAQGRVGASEAAIRAALRQMGGLV